MRQILKLVLCVEIWPTQQHSFAPPIEVLYECISYCQIYFKGHKMLLKMSFCKVLRGIQSGNDGDLDTAKPYISKFCASEQDPSLFSCVRARHLARSHDCFNGETVCRLLMKKSGQINIFHWKIFRKREEKKKNELWSVLLWFAVGTLQVLGCS